MSVNLPKRVTVLACTELEVPSGLRERLVGAVVARRRKWVFRNPWRLPPMPPWPASYAAIAGTVGSVWVRFEPLAHIAWIGEARFEVPDAGNVVLLDLGGRGRAPQVVGTAHVEAEFPTSIAGDRASALRAARAGMARLSEALLASPEVRRFVEG